VYICHECGETYDAPGFCGRDGAELAARGDDLLLGTTLGSWRVASLIGTGGMGRVYKAVQPNIGGRVAIKILNNQAAGDDQTVQRFFAEARAVNLIRHENIINVLDLATMNDGRPYIVMEYLDGAPLSDIIHQRGSLPLGGFANVLIEILDALDAAHAKGIIHRDLKPANVFITPGGHARLLDFGIAKLAPELDGRTSATRTGSLLGTPQYMSPEQASAQPMDNRTDLYAVGVMMYEGITGQVPFSAASLFDLLRKHLEEPPRPLRELRSDVPPALDSVVLRALEKAPDRRFASAREMLEALRASVEGLPQAAWVSVVPGVENVSISVPSTRGASSAGRAAPRASDGPVKTPVGEQRPAGLQAGVADTQSTAPRRGSWLLYAVGAVAMVLFGVGVAALALGGSADEVAETPELVAAVTPPPTAVETPADKPPAPAPGDQSGGDPAAQDPPAPSDPAPPSEAGKTAEKGKGKAAQAEPAGGPNPNKPPPREKRPRRGNKPRAVVADDGADNTRKNQVATTDKGGTGAGDNATKPAMQFRQLPLDSINLRDFDGGAYLRKARKMAREYFPDARLTYAYIQNVKPNGRSDLTLGQAMVTFMFRSKKASVRGDLPRGVIMQCKVVVSVLPSNGITVAPTGDHNCADVILGMPKCSPKQLWDKAIAAGAPTNAVAALMFNRHQGENRWIFTIASDFTQIFPDDC